MNIHYFYSFQDSTIDNHAEIFGNFDHFFCMKYQKFYKICIGNCCHKLGLCKKRCINIFFNNYNCRCYECMGYNWLCI